VATHTVGAVHPRNFSRSNSPSARPPPNLCRRAQCRRPPSWYAGGVSANFVTSSRLAPKPGRVLAQRTASAARRKRRDLLVTSPRRPRRMAPRNARQRVTMT
jgi:hypothetical protein